MTSYTQSRGYRDELPHGRSLGWNLLTILWHVVRLPMLAALLLLEPFVSLTLTALGFLGIAVAMVLKLSGDLPHFPLWLMIIFSVGAILMLMAYHVLIGIFSR
jgi:hypothetical protein